MVREIIEKNSLFKGIQGESLERMLVCSKACLKTYKRGEIIFHQEETAQVIYVLLTGRVAIVKQLVSGRKNILYEVDEGHVFGEHYFFGGNQVYKYGAQAATEIEVLEIPWGFFYGFCSEACAHHH